MESRFSNDNKGEKLTDQLPHYIKEESIGFRRKNKAGSDIVTDLMEKYCPPERHADLKKCLHKSMVLSKQKVKPNLNIIPRAKKSHLSLREKKKLGLYKLPKKGLKYQEFLQLNALWKQYMLDSIDFSQFCNHRGQVEAGDRQWELLGGQLYKADYHGALLTVIRSRCPSHVGAQGIVVMDTRNVFRLLDKDNTVRSIPKESSVFQLQLDRYQLTVYGRHLCARPAERSTKKFRSNLMMDL